MISSLAKRLTSQFYEWEILGRGWLLAPTPIDLEPPFTPFFGHRPPQVMYVDDGLHHTIFSRVGSLFNKKNKFVPVEHPEVDYGVIPFDRDDQITIFRLLIPKEYHGTNADSEQLLTMLTFCTTPVSFEFRATASTIAMYCSCRSQYASYVKAQLKTYFSNIGISEELDDPGDILHDDTAFAIIDFGLEEEFVRPIVQARQSKFDTLISLFSILNHLEKGQEIFVQVLCNGLVNRWEQSILKSVSTNTGGPFFENAPEMLSMAKEKISSPLLAASVRVLVQADTLPEAMSVLQKIAFSVRNASKSAGNALIPLPSPNYTIEQRLSDMAFRESHRTGMLLSVKELASFVRIPTAGGQKLWGKARKTKQAPNEALGNSFTFGINNHEGIEVPVSLSEEQRLRHVHIIGATGTGKSTLLLRMMAQDIRHNRGFALLDPHGDLFEQVLSIIPENRLKDVVIVDPSDSEFPVAFNILFAHSAIEKEILASDLVSAFRRNSGSWGDQMNSIFANAIIAFLESTKGGTLADLRRFLIEKPYRESFLKTVTDPSIRYYWQKEYGLLRSASIGPILTRLDTFLRPRLIRNMVCQPKGLDFDDILNSKKILLIKLSQGLIGAENSYLLGTLFVSKIQQAAFARQAREIRTDFYLYADEFHHFITPSMEEILSGGRKYHLGFILAHQDMQQVQKQDGGLAGAVIGNAGIRICFRIGEGDAKKMAEGFSSFESTDLQNLGIGDAIARIERPDQDFSLTIPNTAELQTYGLKEKLLEWSRHRFSTPKAEVEAMLAKSLYPDDNPVIEEKPQPQPKFRKDEKEIEVKPKENDISVTLSPSSTDSLDQFEKRKKDSQHRYLQTLIKKMAEARGFKATIESSIPGGNGKVDVLLERKDMTVACEVSITTDPTWELHNIQKCLKSGYTTIVSCVPELIEKGKMKTFFQTNLSAEEYKKVMVLLPDELFALLDDQNVTPSETESTLKGYRVKVNYDQISASEMKQKKESIAKVVIESLKRIKK